MLEKAEEKYYAETIKPAGNWGDGMRLSKLPRLAAWEKARARVEELEAELALRESVNSIERITS